MFGARNCPISVVNALICCRFGHDVVATCEYCHSYGDFAFFALSTSILSYIREIAIVGVRSQLSFPFYKADKVVACDH